MMSSASLVKDRLVTGFPVYYGWVIMVVGTIGLIMTGPGQTYGVSIFWEHLIRELDVSRSTISTLYTLGTLIGSFALPYVGRMIDQRGTRLMVVVISVLFGVACIYMGVVMNVVMLAFGFIAIRMLGQGSLSLVSQNVINQWWVRRRGMIMGVSGAFLGLAGVGGLPLLINALINNFGWRITYMLMGLMLLLIMAPLGYLFFRDRPELYGLQPDGGLAPTEAEPSESTAPSEASWTLEEARRTTTFWWGTLGVGTTGMMGTGLFIHMGSVITDNGLHPDIAACRSRSQPRL